MAAFPHAVKHARYLPGLRLLLCVLAGTAVLYGLLRPDVRPVAVVKDGAVTHISSWAGTRIEEENDEHEILVHVHSPLPLGVLQFYVDDCVEAATVNGRPVRDEQFPYCNWFDYMVLDVSDYTHVGTNTVQVRLHNDLGGGSLVATASHASWLFRSALAVVLLAIAAFAAHAFRLEGSTANKTSVALLAVGALLRIVHAAYTDFDTLAYDWDGHIEYMQYIADHWMLPPGDEGWEFHQQPLYYIFGGAVLALARGLHAQDSFVAVMQFFSLLMTLGTLGACGWIAALLFPAGAKNAAVARGVFLGLLATMPGAIMFASRINNDVPTYLFAALCVAFLLHWWKSGSFDSWAGASIMLAMALLTKSSALPLLAPVGLAYLLRREPLRDKLRNGAVLGGLLAIVLGGTLLVRVFIQGQEELVPVWVTSGLHVKNFPAAYYTFLPWEVLEHPFNHNWIDTHRRQFFWEYLLKSSFFGEWEFEYFRVQALVLLTAAMLLVPAGLYGLLRSLRRRSVIDILMALFLATSLAALATFRFLHPNSSNQELRYVIFVLIPAAYALAVATENRWVRLWIVSLACVLCALSAWLILAAAAHAR